jgi:2-iminobutanoate/2-iminopropanoate deaminase
MKKLIIRTDRAPRAIGPYEQAVRIDNLLFTSGQVPLDPKDNTLLKGDIRAETRRVFENLKGILEAAGSSLDKVLKVTIYLRDLKNFEEMNRVYEEYFGKSKPARSCVEVSALPKEASIEADLIASIE